MVIRLEDVKKVLSILYNERQRFSKIESSIEDNFEKLESRCQLSSLLDENFGLIRANAAFEVDDDHFARADDPNVEQKVQHYDHQQVVKYLLFVKTKEVNRHQSQKRLKQILDQETDSFISEN